MRVLLATVAPCLFGGIAIADTISWDAKSPEVVGEAFLNPDGSTTILWSAKCSGPLTITTGNAAKYYFRKAGTMDTWNTGGVSVKNGKWNGALAVGGKWEIKPVIEDKTGKVVAEGAVKTADIPIN